VRDLEVIAVEHSSVPEYEKACGPGVRYVHIARASGAAFNKSRALNAGVRASRGSVVVLHDGDILVPVDYVASVLDRIGRGFEGLQPVRLLFYLGEDVTRRILHDGFALPASVQSVGHNYPGGSTVATRAVFEAIGGHDERFDERGGDDIDFLDRLKTRRFFAGGYLPAVHLWHATDPTFRNSEPMASFKEMQLGKPAAQRIRELLDLGQGAASAVQSHEHS
jgi:hypothetical protein